MKEQLLEKFKRYISIDTQSDPASDEFPSSPGQHELARLLVNELKELGLEDAHADEHAYVMATLPANISRKAPVIGFIAHLDTSPDVSGKNVRPVVHEQYDGNDLVLDQEKNHIMPVKDFPVLKNYIGQTLITSDGSTLLGADDKAGIAEIMEAVAYLTNNPDIPHGKVKILFTPDEEIGKGSDGFNPETFNADYAYTVDGGAIGEIQYENFNAALANIGIQGRNIHPGAAKNIMINANLVGMAFCQMLPEGERPEHTEKREGFYHITDFRGTVEKADIQMLIRNHDKQKFEHKKEKLRKAANFLNDQYGSGTIHVDIKDQYYNMNNKIYPVMHIIEQAREAMEQLDIEPATRPIRGGTDGARLSYMGLPCPNLFTGGHNFHGKYEFIPLESMEKATMTIVKILEIAAFPGSNT